MDTFVGHSFQLGEPGFKFGGVALDFGICFFGCDELCFEFGDFGLQYMYIFPEQRYVSLEYEEPCWAIVIGRTKFVGCVRFGVVDRHDHRGTAFIVMFFHLIF
jgi:hypothetical protein